MSRTAVRWCVGGRRGLVALVRGAGGVAHVHFRALAQRHRRAKACRQSTRGTHSRSHRHTPPQQKHEQCAIKTHVVLCTVDSMHLRSSYGSSSSSQARTSVRHDAAGVEVGQQPALQLPLSRRRRGPGHALGGAARAAVVARSLWSRGGSLYVEVSDDDRKVLQATFFSIISLFLNKI